MSAYRRAVPTGGFIGGGGAIAPPLEWSLKSFLVTSFPIFLFQGLINYSQITNLSHQDCFSTLTREEKTWLRLRMSEGRGRLTGLALLHIHRDIPVNAQAVIERFAKRKKNA